MKKKIQIIGLFSFLFLLFATRAEANVPIYQISQILSFSIRALIETSGKTLLMVVLIEMVVLRRYFDLGYRKAFLYSFLANLFSTMIGFATSVGSSTMMSVPVFLIGSIMLSGMLQRVLQHDERIKKKSIGLGIMLFLLFIGMSLTVFWLAALSTPGKTLSWATSLTFASSRDMYVAVLAAFGLFAAGYLISVITEGYVLSRLIPHGKRLIKIVLLMNLFSYLALVILLSPTIKQTIEDKTWFFYRGAYSKLTSVTLYEQFQGDWADYSMSWEAVLKEHNYWIRHYWPGDGKALVRIAAMQKDGDEWIYPDDFPETIDISFTKDDQGLIVAEISLGGRDEADNFGIHQTNHCLSGVFKESLLKSLKEKGYPAHHLACTTGRWSENN